MKTRSAKSLWKIIRYLALSLLTFIVLGLIGLIVFAYPGNGAQKTASDTRKMLRQQGFKLDLAEFNSSNSPDEQMREALLKGYGPQRAVQFNVYLAIPQPSLTERVGSNSVVVVWRQEAIKRQTFSGDDNSEPLTWAGVREAPDQAELKMNDPIYRAILSDPIRFNLAETNGLPNRVGMPMLPQLASIRNLIQTFGNRCLLLLHDGDLPTAWTNLLAATRLVTAWEMEPTEPSYQVRYYDVERLWDFTWQALQTNGWTEEQLARLQHEWEAVDFLKGLPDTAAFNRASAVAICELGRHPSFLNGVPFSEFFSEAIHHPQMVKPVVSDFFDRLKYAQTGSYEDETSMLLFYRDRELELRHAIQCPTWAEMSRLPGVTTNILYQSTNRLLPGVSGRVSGAGFFRMRLAQMGNLFQLRGLSLTGRAAEAEARRRILITAIALERYHLQHAAYPPTLPALSPEFVKSPVLDFMDGQPLRYRPINEGHFLLYSIGPDLSDDGGTMLSTPFRTRAAMRGGGLLGNPRVADIVWPLPAASEAVLALRQHQLVARRAKADKLENLQANAQWEHTMLNQQAAEKLLAANPTQLNSRAPRYHGRALNELLRNPVTAGTNQMTWEQMLTLNQIITGGEPEKITFEIPIAYDAVTNHGVLFLAVDDINDNSDEGCHAQQMEFNRAANGNCQIVWNTLFESPGKHALRAGLFLRENLTDNFESTRPPLDTTGPVSAFLITNLCQFSLSSAQYDAGIGATLHARLPEKNAHYVIELTTTNGAPLKTIIGATSNGIIRVNWDLIDDLGQRCTNDFESIFHLAFPDSGRSQTLRGP